MKTSNEKKRTRVVDNNQPHAKKLKLSEEHNVISDNEILEQIDKLCKDFKDKRIFLPAVIKIALTRIVTDLPISLLESFDSKEMMEKLEIIVPYLKENNVNNFNFETNL
jgi:hypothetical protein